jgi:hypothetical protein
MSRALEETRGNLIKVESEYINTQEIGYEAYSERLTGQERRATDEFKGPKSTTIFDVPRISGCVSTVIMALVPYLLQLWNNPMENDSHFNPSYDRRQVFFTVCTKKVEIKP